jgi:hypothetical protein
LHASQAALADAPFWRRPALGQRVEHAAHIMHGAQARRDSAAHDAAPYFTEIQARNADLRRVEHEASVARLRDRLDQITLTPTPGVARGAEIDPPGL